MTLGQVTGMAYLISVQIYALDKSHYFSIDKSFALLCYSLAALIYYIETIILKTRDCLRGRLRKRALFLIVLKETLDNIGVIGYLGLVRRTWIFELASCLGCFLTAVLSLYSNRELR
eukprot:TRINITY_DN8652_c0_g2_i2.p1 TRINITY_DN8652_c0_g2~~TRINITY_DN8652_c0_g2_i2.p1  ORF type:complete len:117 (+),score=6.80 TRINITY_DN8652_c0_g2_i2:282-632(+)